MTNHADVRRACAHSPVQRSQLTTGLALTAGLALAIAGTPFGGDDTGTIPDPSHKTTLKCEDGIGKAVGCIGKCTLSRQVVSREVRGHGDESAEQGRVDLCNCVNVSSLSGVIETDPDSMNNLVYCDMTSGTPFGGDDLSVAKSAVGEV